MANLVNTSPLEGTAIDLKRLDRALSSKNIKLKDEYARLITHLLSIHETGMLHYSVSTNSFELRIPDPYLLVEDGAKELYSKHLYINLTKFIDMNHGAPARCVKNGRVYTMLELLNMKPLRDRQDTLPWDVDLILNKFKQKTLIIPKTAMEVTPDYKVEPPGECIPITELPAVHPAIEYLNSRGFNAEDIKQLYKQFDTSFCISTKQDFYKPLYDGLSKSPVGKLIFFVKHFGELKGWQSRRLEKVIGETKYFYHYDPINAFKSGWVPVAKYDPASTKYKPFPDVPKALMEGKYVIGFGTRASDCLLGFDAALEYGNQPTHSRSIVIVEGALDAGKFGAPACSVFGCRVSKKQAELMLNNFDKIFFIKDHDVAGNELELSLKEQFAALGRPEILKEISYNNCYKDIGEIVDKQELISLREQLNTNL